MRIKIFFRNPGEVILPVNYNHFLTSAIYGYLRESDQEYADFLHDEGYALGQKQFKLFTFSRLICPNRKIDEEKEEIHFLSPLTWFVSSPSETFLGGFAASLLSQQKLRVASTTLELRDLTIPELPRFAEEMHFTCLSPITISTVVERNGKKTQYYYRPDDVDFSKKVRQNLIRKYEVIHGEPPENMDFSMEFAADYIKKRNGRITKLIKFKDVNIVGVLAPFVCKGNPGLIQIGYECGFGDKNSAGFGMVEVIRKRRRYHAT